MDSRNRILLYFGAAAALLIIAIVVRLPSLLEGSPAIEADSSVLIGGEFELVDHKGNTITHEDLMGTYSLIYFGYTFCPDVCPMGLQTMTQALDLMQPRKINKVVPIFITIDPERDTPDVIADYVQHFHPNFVGLTGSADQIKVAAKAYRTYYRKVEEDRDPDYYLMDHSSFIFLMSPDGKYITHYSHGADPVEMAQSMRDIIR